MRAVRVVLVAAGSGTAGWGLWLLWPHLPAAAVWLLAGPILHDALVAPLIGLAGLALGRALPDRVWPSWVGAGLAVTATLLLIAVPLILRPHPAPPNPGLQDRDYATGLAVWLAVLWAGVLAGAILTRRRRRRTRHPMPPPPAPADGGSP